MAESEISTLLVDVATSNSSIDLSLLNDLNNLQTVSLTAEDTETILSSELDLSKFGNLRFQIVDEVDNIYDLIHLIAESNRNSNAVDLSSLIGISNTELNGVLSIDYADYVALSTSAPIFNSLTNVELVVSGTASEIQDLFELDSELLDRVTFNITDGAEVKVSSALLDKLDGRINGAVIVSDDNAGLANVFDDAIPDNAVIVIDGPRI